MIVFTVEVEKEGRAGVSKTYHVVHYRRFEADESPLKGKTLESLCREALDRSNGSSSLWSRPEDRVFNSNDQDGRKIFLNKVADLSGAIFGEMCLVQAKDLQALLSMRSNNVKLSDLTTATVYDLGETEAPHGSQFVRGLAYWIAIGNHLLFVKTQSMTSELLRLYLGWLLRSRVGDESSPLQLVLNAKLDAATIAGDIGEIRSLRVSGKSAPQVIKSEGEADRREVKTSRWIGDKFAKMQKAIPIAKLVLGDERVDSLIESLGPREFLSAEAVVKVQGSRTEESRRNFQAIANDLADESDADVRIEGKDGRITNGDAILRTRMPFNQSYDGSNLLEFDDVANQLQEVYTRFVKDGKIKA